MQLPDVSADSYFLKTFGRPERNITCECERTADPSMTQVLDISNGDTINKKLDAKECRITRWMADKTAARPNHRTRLPERFFPVSDQPRSAQNCSRSSVQAPTGEPRCEDMYWALLSSKEFLFNH